MGGDALQLGLASHWPRVTDISDSPPTGQGLEEREMRSFVELSWLSFNVNDFAMCFFLVKKNGFVILIERPTDGACILLQSCWQFAVRKRQNLSSSVSSATVFSSDVASCWRRFSCCDHSVRSYVHRSWLRLTSHLKSLSLPLSLVTARAAESWTFVVEAGRRVQANDDWLFFCSFPLLLFFFSFWTTACRLQSAHFCAAAAAAAGFLRERVCCAWVTVPQFWGSSLCDRARPAFVAESRLWGGPRRRPMTWSIDGHVSADLLSFVFRRSPVYAFVRRVAFFLCVQFAS